MTYFLVENSCFFVFFTSKNEYFLVFFQVFAKKPIGWGIKSKQILDPVLKKVRKNDDFFDHFLTKL